MILSLIALATCVVLIKSRQEDVIEPIPHIPTLLIKASITARTSITKPVPKPTGFLSPACWIVLRELGWTDINTRRFGDTMQTVVVGRMPCGHRARLAFPDKVVFVGRAEEAAIVLETAQRKMIRCRKCKAVC